MTFPTILVRATNHSPSSLFILDTPIATQYNEGCAEVAQVVEHCTENAGVGGSTPPLGTFLDFASRRYTGKRDCVITNLSSP